MPELSFKHPDVEGGYTVSVPEGLVEAVTADMAKQGWSDTTDHENDPPTSAPLDLYPTPAAPDITGKSQTAAADTEGN